jgi:hypothetical protein
MCATTWRQRPPVVFNAPERRPAVWSDRIDRLKALRENQSRQPYDWIQASELAPGDQFLFGGDWFRVIETHPVEPHVQATASHGPTRTVIDYLAFELVKVAVPRPEGSWTTGPAA